MPEKIIMNAGDMQRALVRITPEGRLLTWDNARFETRS